MCGSNSVAELRFARLRWNAGGLLRSGSGGQTPAAGLAADPTPRNQGCGTEVICRDLVREACSQLPPQCQDGVFANYHLAKEVSATMT